MKKLIWKSNRMQHSSNRSGILKLIAGISLVFGCATSGLGDAAWIGMPSDESVSAADWSHAYAIIAPLTVPIAPTAYVLCDFTYLDHDEVIPPPFAKYAHKSFMMAATHWMEPYCLGRGLAAAVSYDGDATGYRAGPWDWTYSQLPWNPAVGVSLGTTLTMVNERRESSAFSMLSGHVHYPGFPDIKSGQEASVERGSGKHPVVSVSGASASNDAGGEVTKLVDVPRLIFAFYGDGSYTYKPLAGPISGQYKDISGIAPVWARASRNHFVGGETEYSTSTGTESSIDPFQTARYLAWYGWFTGPQYFEEPVTLQQFIAELNLQNPGAGFNTEGGVQIGVVKVFEVIPAHPGYNGGCYDGIFPGDSIRQYAFQVAMQLGVPVDIAVPIPLYVTPNPSTFAPLVNTPASVAVYCGRAESIPGVSVQAPVGAPPGYAISSVRLSCGAGQGTLTVQNTGGLNISGNGTAQIVIPQSTVATLNTVLASLVYTPVSCVGNDLLMVSATTAGSADSATAVTQITLSPPSLSVSVVNPTTLIEGGSPSATHFTITRTAPAALGSAVTVSFHIGGEAGWPEDFTLSGCTMLSGGLGIAVIPANQDYVDIGIQAVDDALRESALEAVTLTILPDAAYSIVNGQAGLWIQDNDCVSAPSGLVGYWRGEDNGLDELSANDGVLAGNLSFQAGKVGQAFVSDGSGDGLKLGNPLSMRLQDFTIECWIKRSDANLISAITGQDALFFSYGQGGYGFGLNAATGKPLLTRIGINSLVPTEPVPITGTTDWYHLAVTKNGSTVIFYVNGVACQAQQYNNGSGYTFGTDVALGARGDNLGNSFKGAIDDLGIYNRALTATEIQAIHAAGSAGKCSPIVPAPCPSAAANMIGFWRGENNGFDELEANSGVLAGNLSFQSGKVGQAFVSDGSGDGLKLGNPLSMRLQDFTIECWIKRSDANLISAITGQDALFFSYGTGGYGFGLNAATGKPLLTRIGINSLVPAEQVPITGTTDWYHLAVTKNGSTVVFYVNGVACQPQQYSNGTGHTFSSDVALGARGDNLGNSFKGAIDELSIYNRALSASEIQTIYNSGTAGKCQ